MTPMPSNAELSTFSKEGWFDLISDLFIQRRIIATGFGAQLEQAREEITALQNRIAELTESINVHEGGKGKLERGKNGYAHDAPKADAKPS